MVARSAARIVPRGLDGGDVDDGGVDAGHHVREGRGRPGGGERAAGRGNRSPPAHQDPEEGRDGGDERERQDEDGPRHLS